MPALKVCVTISSLDHLLLCGDVWNFKHSLWSIHRSLNATNICILTLWLMFSLDNDPYLSSPFLSASRLALQSIQSCQFKFLANPLTFPNNWITDSDRIRSPVVSRTIACLPYPCWCIFLLTTTRMYECYVSIFIFICLC